MATTTIPWGDGSGDNIYLTYPSASGDQTVEVSSDANTGVARSKVVTFTSGVGNITQQLTVSQGAGSIQPIFYDLLVFDGSAYINTNVIPPENASFAVPLSSETRKGSQRLFMCLCSNTTNTGAILNNSTGSSRRYFSIYYGTYSNISSNRNLSFNYAGYSFFLTPKRFGWGDTSYTFTKGGESPIGGLILGSNTGHDGNPYTGRMGTIQIYGSDAQNATTYTNLVNNFTPVATLRPCTYNGEAGMWHVEGNAFYGNSAGVGTLSVTNS